MSGIAGAVVSDAIIVCVAQSSAAIATADNAVVILIVVVNLVGMFAFVGQPGVGDR